MPVFYNDTYPSGNDMVSREIGHHYSQVLLYTFAVLPLFSRPFSTLSTPLKILRRFIRQLRVDVIRATSRKIVHLYLMYERGIH